MKKIDFYKMSGSGNDFIIIDNRNKVIGETDLSNFVARLRDLLEHPLKFEGIGEGAKSKVRQEYDWDEVVRETEKVYQEVMRTTS